MASGGASSQGRCSVTEKRAEDVHLVVFACEAGMGSSLIGAIDQVGAVLVAEGLVTQAYVDAMHAREAIVSTYLGNGIALPHGTNESQDAVRRTGLAVIQFPAGVPWGEEPARLVIGLAA